MLTTRTTAALGVAALIALTGCSEDTPTLAGPTTSGPAPSPIAAGSTLLALVGTKDSPEAFEISLTDEAGAPVTALTAGSYSIKVTDESKIHNFSLRGDGVEMATSISGKESPTWTVTFKAGDYTYTCTPHPSMSGSFIVT